VKEKTGVVLEKAAEVTETAKAKVEEFRNK
jgi:hypothetical protein